MSKVLIISELSGDQLKPVTLEILGKLKGQKAHVAIFGDLPDAINNELANHGVEQIYCLKGEHLEHYSPDGHAQALKKLIEQDSFDYVFAGATSQGKDLLPRVAGIFKSPMASEVTHFTFEEDSFSATRPLFAGKCLAKVELTGPRPHFITVRPNALGLDNQKTTGGTANKSDIQIDPMELKAVVKEVIKGASSKLDLTEANIIVSGGRAMKDAKNFDLLEELASVLGATVGASRAAVDSGYAPHDMQVGQTGKTVSPTLYIACGISGAIQHLAGMRTSKIIVAINTDPDAPIFSKADYGIVGDLFQIVPLLTQEFKKIL
jgi:electron transfer flavoprotein alpha subunit